MGTQDISFQSMVGKLQRVGHGRVGQRVGRGLGHRAGHVRHAVEQRVVHAERRVIMGGRPRILEAAALVDGDVHQNGARLHLCDKRIRYQPGRFGAGHQDGADHQVGTLDGAFQLVRRRVASLDVAGELRVKQPKLVDVDVEDHHAGPHAAGDPGGVVASRAGADHHDVGGLDPRHPAHQHTAAALGPHQVVSPDLGGQPSGDFAHRC